MHYLQKILKKYFFEMSWVIVTVIIILTASIAQMYSRAITLDNVHKKDFERVYKLLNEHQTINKNQLNIRDFDRLLSYLLFWF